VRNLNGAVLPFTVGFRQPTFPSGAGHGKIATWWVNGTQVNTATPWAVYKGANLTVENNILSLNDGTNRYVVDYSCGLPNFYQGTAAYAPTYTPNFTAVPTLW
jgi:hypothetical protein